MTSSIFCTPFKNFFPCFDSGPLSEVPSEPTADSSATPPFKKRFCADWRIIPALVTLVACILGVVFSIIWNHPYLSIPFAIGGLCDLYLLYVSYHYRHLQSLEQSSKHLEKQASEYKQHNEKHLQTVLQLESQVTDMKSKLTDLQSTNESLSVMKDDFEKQMKQMKVENQQLTETLKAYNEALEQQKSLVDQLKDLEGLMQSDHQQIAQGLGTFSTNLESYKSTIQANENTAVKLKNQLDSTSNSLTTIFQSMQQLLTKTELKDVLELNSAAKSAKTELEQVTIKLKEMKELEETLRDSVTTLKSDLREVASHGTQMKSATLIMEQTTDVMKQVIALKTPSGANLKEEDDDDKNSQ